ncbi:MAG: hypothetical protein EPO07_19975 [Verrucomicrobia bacterium]|nr:MAG: hypothetical protein EPO07_19975 [Verrucomicrobiota bacterium]
MKTKHLPLLTLASLTMLLWGCASQPADTAARKGHYVTLPPETGSIIGRRVWVDDNGTTNNVPSNVTTVSGAAMNDVQRKGAAKSTRGN